MAAPAEGQGNIPAILIKLIERKNLYHVKTLPYDDTQGVLRWLGLSCEHTRGQDTVSVVEECIRTLCVTDVEVISITDVHNIQGKPRVLVYVKRDRSGTSDSIVLFRVVQWCNTNLNNNIKNVETLSQMTVDALPGFKLVQSSQINAQAKPQECAPIIDGYHQPTEYKTVSPKVTGLCTDGFHRKHVPIQSTREAETWRLYSCIPGPDVHEVDIEGLITSANNVLGRGGFGVTVPITNDLVVKTSLFPDMVDWSIPFISEDFRRYAHVASQMEELMIGVSMKHPHILRTFGGYWCDIPGYQLGGRSVLVMERALCSLHEFLCVHARNTVILPVVELDTLKGLEYLRSRVIQHKDFTYRNVLVCSQPERRPIPFAFKISDFGTACNFSTPDQPRGNRLHMAPEILWCLNATSASDIFSWYCVMWELHNRTPLIEFKAKDGVPGYCKKTYAANLSKLVGVYKPYDMTALDRGHLKAIDACSLYHKYKDNRPTAAEIDVTLRERGVNITDKQFVSIGNLCVTLFPQERWSPSELLSLERYRRLDEDVSSAHVPVVNIPLSVRVGEYRATDIIVAEDCVPVELTGKDHQVITHTLKPYYGLDLLRLVPDVIQPYQWYRNKVESMVSIGGRGSRLQEKRKASDAETHLYVRRSKLNDQGPGTSAGLCTRSVAGIPSFPIQGLGPQGGMGTGVEHRGSIESPQVRGRVTIQDIPACNVPHSERVGKGPVLRSGQVPLNIVPRGQPANQSPAQEALGNVVAKVKRVKGEIDTMMVILKSSNEAEMRLFKDNVIVLSQTMTRMYPMLFTGPRNEWCRCSMRTGMVIFQYAHTFQHWTRMSTWNPCNEAETISMLYQVFSTLKLAVESNVLPIHMRELCLVTSEGSVMIDVIPYLCNNYTTSHPLFGNQCPALMSLCASLVTKYIPNDSVCTLLKSTTSHHHQVSHTLTNVMTWLEETSGRRLQREPPRLMPLHGLVTFKDYTTDIPNWLTGKGEPECDGPSTAKVLVYGEPSVLNYEKLPTGDLDDVMLHTIVKSIVMRLKVRVFGSYRLQVTALDCTRAPFKISINPCALAKVPRVDELDGATLNLISGVGSHRGGCTMYTYDGQGRLWAPVVMFTKLRKEGPLPDFTYDFYRVVILIVTVHTNAQMKELHDVFRNLTLFSGTEY